MPRNLEHVFQHGGLHVEGETPALAVAERNPVETHLPAVHVTIDVYGGVRYILLHEIVSCGEAHFPLSRDVDLALDVERVHHVARIFVGVYQPVIGQVVRKPVGERIVESKRPLPPVIVLFLLVLRVRLYLFPLERILVDAPVQCNAEVGGRHAEKPVVDLPFVLIHPNPILIDDVRIKHEIERQVQLFEQRAAA